jgi:predicted metal-binding membrane protein
MGGTMGLGLAAFLGVWTLMMAAMMAPSVAPVGVLYARTVQAARGPRLAGFGAAYLAVWALAGIPAFLLAIAVDQVAMGDAKLARLGLAGVLVVAGVYELSPLKRACLRHCRSPFGLLMHYASFRGSLRDVRAGLHHAVYCLGCCWALFAVIVAVGTMSIVAMVVLAAVVFVEKRWLYGAAFSRALAVVALALAAVVAFTALAA